IVGRPELERPIHHHGRQKGDAEGADRTGNERADGRGRERRAGAAVARHLVTLERRDDGGALARRVEQNRRGRAAIHRAIVNAGEKDECRGGLDLEGDRQEQRDGQRRAEARKDADGGAQRGAHQAPQEIHRSERDRKAVEKLREGIHLSCPPPRSAVRSWSRASQNRYRCRASWRSRNRRRARKPRRSRRRGRSPWSRSRGPRRRTEWSKRW